MEDLIGKVVHYYNRIGVAVIKLEAPMKLDDHVLFLGHTTDFVQTVKSLEIDHKKVDQAPAGAEVAVQVMHPVRRGDRAIRVTESAVLREAHLEALDPKWR